MNESYYKYVNEIEVECQSIGTCKRCSVVRKHVDEIDPF